MNLFFVNEGTSTNNTPQEQNTTLPNITPVDMETPNCILIKASTKNDSDRFNNLKGEVNNNTVNFAVNADDLINFNPPTLDGLFRGSFFWG